MAWIDGQKVKLCKYCSEPGHTQFQCPKRKLENQKKPLKKPITRNHQKTPEKRKNDRSKIIKLLDKEFSKYWRKRQIKDYGFCRCFICGKRLSYEQACIGHFKSRRFISVRFNEYNAHVICYKCNEINSKQPEILKQYEQRIKEEYGEHIIRELNQISGIKIPTEELRPLLARYREMNRNLDKELEE